ncbi:MAG: topoisomerase DNA-binding C4 zinc finger domain-containing protein, partial [Desulfobulbaceae bacterium]|nr:topoisomerase DNA-binding C4 zinc finger domain-containing protein [Desulfobulbaceae bacterium]
LLVRHFPAIINTEFTASMEQNLDRVEEGSVDWLRILHDFYGPFRQALDQAKNDMKSVKRTAVPTDVKCKLCAGVMVIKWGRKGEFLACENYPECKNTQDFKKDDEGNIVPLGKEEPLPSGAICEKCGQPLVYKNGRYGRFLACSGYPECKHIQAEKTGVQCPEEGCGGELIKKISKKGKVFYSCNHYPKCRFAIWDKPVNEPCPDCQSPYLLEKENKRYGLHVKCPNEKCGYMQKLTAKDEGV